MNITEIENIDDQLKLKIIEILKNIIEMKITEEMEKEIKEFMKEMQEEKIFEMYNLPEGLEEDQENIFQLQKWIEEGGGSTDGLEVRFMSNVYRGVFLKRPAKVWEILIFFRMGKF